jgi:hypothetical protein
MRTLKNPHVGKNAHYASADRFPENQRRLPRASSVKLIFLKGKRLVRNEY